MADAPHERPAVAEAESKPAPRRGWVGAAKIAAFLLVIVLVECAVAAFFLPSAAQTEAMATALHAAPGDHSVLPEEEQAAMEPLVPEADKVEVSLGEFGVTSYQPLTNTTLRIDFQLFATVLAADEAKLTHLLEGNQHRFREQVLVILRSAEMTDLTDAGLGLIKRKILEKTNRLFGQAVIQEVIFSEFSFIEQ